LLEVDAEGNLNGTVEAVIYHINPNKSARNPRRKGGGSRAKKVAANGNSRPNQNK